MIDSVSQYCSLCIYAGRGIVTCWFVCSFFTVMFVVWDMGLRHVGSFVLSVLGGVKKAVVAY